MKAKILKFPQFMELIKYAACRIEDLAEKSIKRSGIFTLVLSGGKTPRCLYETLAQLPYLRTLHWDRIHLFWGDERCTSPWAQESNYALAWESFISKVSIPPENIHRILGEHESPEEGARLYEASLKTFFKDPSPSGRSQLSGLVTFPSFDLILLGMGGDGHVASLFPHDPLLAENEKWVGAVLAPKGSPAIPRITLTLPVINNARNVFFLIAGLEKSSLAISLLENSRGDFCDLPAAQVRPKGELTWLLAGNKC